MQLRLKFGISDGTEIVSWYGTNVKDFYKHIVYQSTSYEFVLYDKSYGASYEYTLTFSKTSNYPGSFYELPNFNALFGYKSLEPCSCGAKHDKGNPSYHYPYCKLHIPKK